MSYRESCDLCGVDFDDDNLATCSAYGRWFCYHCGDCGAKCCSRCNAVDGTGRGEGPPTSAGTGPAETSPGP
jgi:hypothetical protein